MVDSIVQAFVDAKMERADISMALYAVATAREETALAKKVGKRAQAALDYRIYAVPPARKQQRSNSEAVIQESLWASSTISERRGIPW
jgi:hypothetical protein